jgi:hypothetical protein
VICLSFEANTRSTLGAQIVKVNSNFNPDSFDALYQKIKRLMTTVLFSEIENWLLDQLKNGKLYVINGLLAALYFDLNCFKEAKEFAYIARQDFPDIEIWDNIIIRSAQAEAVEEIFPEDIFK